jgi:hypothetical protein
MFGHCPTPKSLTVIKRFVRKNGEQLRRYNEPSQATAEVVARKGAGGRQ